RIKGWGFVSKDRIHDQLRDEVRVKQGAGMRVRVQRLRAGEGRELRAKLGRFADLWRAGEVELEGSVLRPDPNLSCPCLQVEGDLFVDFTSGVGRREYLDANLRRPGEAGLGICLLAAFRREPCDVDGFNTVRG